MTAKRQSEMEQLVNDIAENMNMKRWKRQDLIDCINWRGDLSIVEIPITPEAQ